MSDEGEGIVDAFGVAQERRVHPVSKGGWEDAKHVEGAIGFRRVDGQRLYKGPGTAGMGATPRLKSTGGGTVNKASPGAFKVRKRTLKG
jgi:hypothetical protein